MVELLDFLRKNGTTSTAKNADMVGAPLAQQIVYIFEKFVVPALVRRQGNTLYIFLDGGIHNFLCAAVMSKVDDLCAGTLHNAPHDIDSRIVPIKKRCCRHNPHMVMRRINSIRLV